MALSELTARRLKPPRAGKRREKYDGIIPGLAVRITDRGARSWILVYTHGGRRRRYTIGRVGEIGLDEAREKARELRGQARQGRDPAAEQKLARSLAKIATAPKTFREAVDLYTKRVLKDKRRGREVRMTIDKHLMPAWAELPITSITSTDISQRVEAMVDAGMPSGGRRIFEIARRLFSWATTRAEFKLERSPCEKLRPLDLVGKKKIRTRILSDPEWRALSRAVQRLEYPFKQVVELLTLTALRRNEVGHARWREFDLNKKEWTIPKERMKGDVVHLVPLTPQMIAIIEGLPRTGEFLFPNRLGVRPLAGHSTLKKKLDAVMFEELRREDPTASLESFVFHDIRRSIRTQLSMLPVPGGDLVRELILAHRKPGLHQVYDQHSYINEKRRALELWQEKLASILERRSADVIDLAQRDRA